MSPELDYLESDFKLACDIRDSVIPLALENYLGVLDDSDSEESDESQDWLLINRWKSVQNLTPSPCTKIFILLYLPSF